MFIEKKNYSKIMIEVYNQLENIYPSKNYINLKNIANTNQ